jgi:hypothetical protein
MVPVGHVSFPEAEGGGGGGTLEVELMLDEISQERGLFAP